MTREDWEMDGIERAQRWARMRLNWCGWLEAFDAFLQSWILYNERIDAAGNRSRA